MAHNAGPTMFPLGGAFSGTIRETAQESSPAWESRVRVPDSAPNIITVVLDDVGFAQLGCFGGLGGRIETPHIDRLAENGLRFRNFHTTPLCSPTRAALLTGRNAHSVGVGSIMEYATGFPGYNSRIPKSAAMMPAILRECGYSTMAVGKWHLTPDDENGPWGPFDRWPLGQGFDRFYGFLPGETSQWAPELWEDNHRTDPPPGGRDEYHLTEDLVDRTVQWIDSQRSVAADRPFYTYLALGAAHAPHHAPRRWIDHYRGAFDEGWDVIRRQTLEHQQRMGVVPDGVTVQDHSGAVPSWSSLTDLERRVFARQMEVFAAFVSHTDEQIGRLLNYLQRSGLSDDTVVMLLSDNGASAEGGRNGLYDEISFYNRVPESVDEMADRLEEWGSATSHPHYSLGWAEAGNTPNRWYKTTAHEGGTRVPMILHWPGGVRDAGAIRDQFVHVVDVVPTLLDMVGIDFPHTVARVEQSPLEGQSFAGVVADGAISHRREQQHFECFGHRAIWSEGWKAVAVHWSSTHAFRVGMQGQVETTDGRYDLDDWELYRLEDDFAESRNLARDHPDVLDRLVELWWSEAAKFNVLPIEDRGSERMNTPRPGGLRSAREFTFHGPIRLGRSSSPDIRNRSFVIEASVSIDPQNPDGVVVAQGGSSGGFALCVVDGCPAFAVNYLGRRTVTAVAEHVLTSAPVVLRVEFRRISDNRGDIRLLVDGYEVAVATGAQMNPVLLSPGQGLEVGADSTTPVWTHYRSPFTFAGVIERVHITLDPADLVDPRDEQRIAEVQQ